MVQTKKKEEKMAVQTSYPGSKLLLSSIIILALSISTAVSTWRFRKNAELSRWKKTMNVYNLQLEQENLAAIKGIERK